MKIADIKNIKSRWDTSHECECCDKHYCGKGAALVILQNDEDRIICQECVTKFLTPKEGDNFVIKMRRREDENIY